MLFSKEAFTKLKRQGGGMAAWQSALVRDQMHNLGASNRLAGGLIDHARLEGLFPSVGGSP
jgi:hypothetical protein